MSLLSKSQMFGLLLLIALLVPINVLPELVRSLLGLGFIIGIVYLIFWWISGLVRAPQAYQEGKKETQYSMSRKHDK